MTDHLAILIDENDVWHGRYVKPIEQFSLAFARHCAIDQYRKFELVLGDRGFNRGPVLRRFVETNIDRAGLLRRFVPLIQNAKEIMAWAAASAPEIKQYLPAFQFFPAQRLRIDPALGWQPGRMLPQALVD